MQPLSLTLRGFRGIRDGLGHDELTLDFVKLAGDARLVAIVGANGRGKTTVMDNMHPYLCMPSRGTSGSSGFSYYDHVCLPENEKDLTWRHGDALFRSHIVIRIGSRRKTEAFLFERDMQGNWQPIVLADGTVSDGKIDSYTRCVESICGRAETFFTSVFAAQGKRQLSTYRNAEVKALMADLLGQDEIVASGLQAAEVTRLIRAGLTALRQEATSLTQEDQRLESEYRKLEGAAARVPKTLSAREHALAAQETTRNQLARLQAEQAQQRGIETRRSELQTERRRLGDSYRQSVSSLEEQETELLQLTSRLDSRIRQRHAQQRQRRDELAAQQRRLQAILHDAWLVAWAGRRLALASHLFEVRQLRVQRCRGAVEKLTRARSKLQLLEQRQAGIERDAGQAVLKVEELKQRIGLTRRVPCAGTDLQGRCTLLENAHEARSLVPSAQRRLAQLREEQEAIRQTLTGARAYCDRRAWVPDRLPFEEHCLERARERTGRLRGLVDKQTLLASAAEQFTAIEPEIQALQNPGLREESAEDRAEREQLAAARRRIATARLENDARRQRELERIDQALRVLPPPFDEAALQSARHHSERVADQCRRTEQDYLAALREVEAGKVLARQHEALRTKQAVLAARIVRIERELGDWTLFARCMSHDGLIALAIDDAGPALAGLTNMLLAASYGERFTVSIQTLLETAKGDAREGFDIVVFDSETGEYKSVALMSGGERVWINECLVRAVALYLAEHSGRHYETLFSDEADGALDPERKRMFMAMKREVLRLGGYRQEFFVSQTPELAAMADVTIDLGQWNRNARTCEMQTAGLPG